MTLVLSNGGRKIVDAHATIICAIPGKVFDIKDAKTWESDRAWVFATVGRIIWTGKDNETATITEIIR